MLILLRVYRTGNYDTQTSSLLIATSSNKIFTRKDGTKYKYRLIDMIQVFFFQVLFFKVHPLCYSGNAPLKQL